jgi:hypothetical protein
MSATDILLTAVLITVMYFVAKAIERWSDARVARDAAEYATRTDIKIEESL